MGPLGYSNIVVEPNEYSIPSLSILIYSELDILPYKYNYLKYNIL